MSASTIYQTFQIDYTGPGNTVAAKCRVNVQPGAGDTRIAIVSELPDNGGASITNAAERIAELICIRLGIDPGLLVYIEHYPEHADGDPVPDWDLVTFKARRVPVHAGRAYTRFGDAEWRPLTKSDVAELGIAEPRKYCLEHQSAAGLDAQPFDLWTIERPVALPEPGYEWLAWYSTHPLHHGERAIRLAMDHLKALYRGRSLTPEHRPGDEVLGLMPYGSDRLEPFRGTIKSIKYEGDNRRTYTIAILKRGQVSIDYYQAGNYPAAQGEKVAELQYRDPGRRDAVWRTIGPARYLMPAPPFAS